MQTAEIEILRDSIKYLGRMVDRHDVRPDPDAVEAVLIWKAPELPHSSRVSWDLPIINASS